MTTCTPPANTPTAVPLMDRTAMYLARRLSELPPVVREEVLDLMAELADCLLEASPLIAESLLAQTSQTTPTGDHALAIRYYFAIFMCMHTAQTKQAAKADYYRCDSPTHRKRTPA